jgi:hypothetical protein
MRIIHLQNISLGIMSITIILAVSVVLVKSITEFGNVGVAYGQGSNSTSSSLPSLTPQQKAAICNPNDKSINATESKICGVPVTAQPNSPNMTTGVQASPQPQSANPSG